MSDAGGVPRFLGPGEGAGYWVRGNRFVFKAAGAETGGGFAIVETDLAEEAAAPTHVHEETDEAVYVLEGEITLEVGTERVRASPGWFAFLPRGVPHRYRPHGPGPVRVLWFLSPAGFEGMWVETGTAIEEGEPPPPPTPPDLDLMARVGRKYRTAFLPGSPVDQARSPDA
jgi:quercetin dioxygenase-like cupin family protein